MRRRWLFPKTLLLSITLLISSFVGIYYNVAAYTDQDRFNYLKLMEEANPSLAKKNSSTPYTATQQHRSMRKDFIFIKDEQKLHLELMSSHAELSLNNDGTNTELIENMQNVVCYMQEELYSALVDVPGSLPMQMIRYFEADHATYSYKSGHLQAKVVRLARYLVPGHQLTDQLAAFEPIMNGTASEVQFSLNGSELNFQASNLKATFSLAPNP